MIQVGDQFLYEGHHADMTKKDEWLRSLASFCMRGTMQAWQRQWLKHVSDQFLYEGHHAGMTKTMTETCQWPVSVWRALCRHDKDNDWNMSVTSFCMKGTMQAWQRQWPTHVSDHFLYEGHHAGMTKTDEWLTSVTNFCMKGTMPAM